MRKRKKFQTFVDCGEFLKIFVRDGFVILFDKSDADVVAKHCWSVDVRPNQSYAITNEGGNRMIRLHRYLVCQDGYRGVVDHINGDGLDNRRCNLRRADYALNALNSHVAHGESRFKGVSRSASALNPWRAAIKVGDSARHLGVFATEEAAAAAYDAEAKRLLSKQIKLNDVSCNLIRNARPRLHGYKGVIKCKNRFAAVVSVANRKKIQVGTFSTAIDAALAYDRYVSVYYVNKPTNKDLGLLEYAS